MTFLIIEICEFILAQKAVQVSGQVAKHILGVFMLRKTTLIVLIMALIGALSAARMQINDEPNSIKILHSTAEEIVLEYHIGQFETKSTEIQSQVWHHLSLPGEGITQDQGLPELPVFNRSIIIDDNAAYRLEAFDLEYTEMQLPVAPSKGVLSRAIDPEKVPYSFDPVYQSKEYYPAQMAELSEPYILRDLRGITVKTTPFAYKADTQTLRIYTAYKLRIYAAPGSQINPLNRSRESLSRDFITLYEKHFLNWGEYRYIPVDDSYGKLLVIAHSSFMTTIQPWVNWKRQKGIETELVEFSAIGSSASQLQSYIQNRYNADPSIAYVQLVGDAQQIPSLSFSGGGSDPSFSLVAGNDYYPDIFIGRFSAETTEQLQVQLSRSIAYERDAATTDTWFSKGIGIASAEGGGSQGDNGESDIQHLNIIRNKLLNYGYSSVDQIYDPGASAATVSTNVNSGRGFINYVGHGSTTSWGTTGFNTSQAMALTNGDKVPVIVDVACLNGNFVSYTCFAEAWMRSPAGGAITIYASTINQSWNSPMRAQDEITDLWVTEAKNTAGGLYYNGSCKMMDIYGNTSTSDGVKMFKTWHIFGDASLMIRTKTPQSMTVSHPNQIIIGAPTLNISTSVANALVSLSYEGDSYACGFTDIAGNINLDLSEIPAAALTFTLTVTAFNRVTYIAEVQQVTGSGPFLTIAEINYTDSNNQCPDYNENGSLDVAFSNIGAEACSNLIAALSTSTSGITITESTQSVPYLAAEAILTINNAFSLSISDDIADGTLAEFNIEMQAGSETWNHEFAFVINAPELSFGAMNILDESGNNNGNLDPGESVTLQISIQNIGGAISPSGLGLLQSNNPGLSIISDSAAFPAIAANTEATLSFELSASSAFPQGGYAELTFSALAGNYEAITTKDIMVGMPDEVIIGTQSNITDSAAASPINIWYKSLHSQAIYTAAELNAAGLSGPLQITAMGYDVVSPPNLALPNFVIRMKHVSAADVSSWQSSTGLQTVYSSVAYMPEAGAWDIISFDTAFEWNGFDNILIDTAFSPVASYSQSGTLRYSTVTNGFRYTRADASDQTNVFSGGDANSNRPNILLRAIIPSSENAVISIDTSSISETVNIGDSVSRQITIANTGDAELIWSIAEGQLNGRSLSGSSLSCDAQSYTAGSTATWNFTVENNSTDYEWIKDIQIDFPSSVTVNSVTSFTGGSYTLTASPESGTGVSINWHYEDSVGYGGIHDGETATATVYVSISSSAMGELNLPWMLTGDDYGSDPHQISGILSMAYDSGTSDPAAWWSVDTSSGIISPGGSASLTLTMNSTNLEEGIYNSALVLESNAINYPQYSIPLTLRVQTPVDSLPALPRFVAEWEPATAALVSYAGGWGQPYALLRDLTAENMLYVIVNSSQQDAAQNSLQANGVNLAQVRFLNAGVDSYWVRDYGPWTIFNDSGEMQIVDFAYNRPRPNDNAIPAFIAAELDLEIYDLGLNHSGGNIMTDGMGKAMSTELILSENSTLSQMQIAQNMEDYLGITDYQIYTDPTNTYIDHIDCWAKLLDVDKVLIRRVPSTHPQYAAIEASVAQWQNQSSSYGTPYRIYRVDTPNNEPYTNSFIFNRQIYVPQMGTAFDAPALAVYQNAMPGYSVTGYTYPGYQSTDALHCRVNTIFDTEMIALQHQAPEALTAYQMQEFSVQISHHNPINQDSTYISWRSSESSPWQISPLTLQGGDTWIASLPAPAYTQNLFYWFQVKDESGRKSTLPLCADADPFVIQVDTQNPNLPDWIPVSYDNPPALIYVDVNPSNNLASPGDLLGAFVDGECRGAAIISASSSIVSIEVQLATAFESVSFNLFSSADGGVYTTDLNLSPNFGEIIGEDEPIELFITLAKAEAILNLLEGELILSWDAVSNADFYRILSSETPQGTYTVLAETESTFYEVDESQPSSFFRVIAIKQEPRRLYKH